MRKLSERPYVVCHMLSSLDGRINGEYFGTQEIRPVLKAFNQIRGQLNCDALLYGATTMAETYADGYIDTLPKPHVIEVLTEDVSDGYLAYLRSLDISYIFAGESMLNCKLLLQKLAEYFEIRRIMLCGGGIVNWTFLQAGAIDELSLVLCPLADGGKGAASVFDRSPYLPQGSPAAFTLKNVRRLPGDGLWLVYRLNAHVP